MRKLQTMLVMAAATLAFSAQAAGFSLSSPAFKNNGAMPDKFAFNSMGCTGENVSPALEWKGAPEGTKSFALLVHDPDAPTGSGWWHWVLYNIPAATKTLPEGAGKSLPAGAVQGNTDFGQPGYGGPCPPPGSGKHHYNFTLYALKVDKLDVPANATAAMVGFYAGANAIAKAKLTGTYERKK